MFEYSWGQVMARAMGSRCYNFSRGGMSAREYIDTFAEAQGFWDPEKRSQAYIIALGVNDMGMAREGIGTLDDIHPEDETKNNRTFIGDYARIISRYKKIEPRAKFFVMTLPHDNNMSKEKYENCRIASELIRRLPEVFDNLYVLDFDRYAPVYDKEFYATYFMGGHMTPVGYVLTAQYVLSYIDFIIRHNVADFREVGYIGTELVGPAPCLN